MARRFIEPEDGGQDVFVHITAVRRAGMTDLREGQRLEFDLGAGRDSNSAAENLVPLD